MRRANRALRSFVKKALSFALVESLLLPGLVLLAVGIAKRNERWGKAFALAGAAGVAVALIAAGPEIYNTLQQGF